MKLWKVVSFMKENALVKQESPAWPQEAYRSRFSLYGGTPPVLSGSILCHVSGCTPVLSKGYHLQDRTRTGPGTLPVTGQYPLPFQNRTRDRSNDMTRGYSLPACVQTNTCENITSRHTTYAGGNYSFLSLSLLGTCFSSARIFVTYSAHCSPRCPGTSLNCSCRTFPPQGARSKTLRSDTSVSSVHKTPPPLWVELHGKSVFEMWVRKKCYQNMLPKTFSCCRFFVFVLLCNRSCTNQLWLICLMWSQLM